MADRAKLRAMLAEKDIRPTDGGGCSYEDCPSYDGKRCRLTGCRPHSCEPAWAEALGALHQAESALHAQTTLAQERLERIGRLEGALRGLLERVGPHGYVLPAGKIATDRARAALGRDAPPAPETATRCPGCVHEGPQAHDPSWPRCPGDASGTKDKDR